jgi:hypothetical protein
LFNTGNFLLLKKKRKERNVHGNWNIYLFIYSFIVGFGVIRYGDYAKRVRSAQETGFRDSGVAIFYIFYSFVAHGRSSGSWSSGVFVSEREREEPPRRQGQGKGLSQLFKYLPLFSFMFMVHVCVHLLPCRFLGPLIIGIKSVGRGSGFPFLFLFLFNIL